MPRRHCSGAGGWAVLALRRRRRWAGLSRRPCDDRRDLPVLSNRVGGADVLDDFGDDAADVVETAGPKGEVDEPVAGSAHVAACKSLGNRRFADIAGEAVAAHEQAVAEADVDH